MGTSRAPITQKLVNEFPDWSNIRNDEQSYGAQLVNSVGLELQDLHEQVKKISSNYTIPFADVNDIDIVYKFQLPGSYNFALLNQDVSNPQYVTPTVVGIVGATTYSVTIADGNDIESFWYDSIPNRLSVISYPVTNTIADDLAATIYGAILSIAQDQSPYTANIILDEPSTRLWVEAIGGKSYVSVDSNGFVARCSVVITGITRSDRVESETLIFLHDNMQPTVNEWKSVIKVEIYNINPGTARIRLFAHQFGRGQSPEIPAPRDHYNLGSFPGSKQDMDTFWDIGTGPNGSSVLKMKSWQVDDIRHLMIGLTDKQTLRSFELLNISSTPITTATDIAIQPFSNRVWITDNTKLYLFDTELSLPSMKILDKKDFDAMAVIEPDTYHTTLSGQVILQYVWRRPITDILRHKVWVKLPNGTLQSIVNGALITFDTAAWVYGTSDQRSLRPPTTLTLSQRGDYIFYLETVFKNGITETDQRIISVDTKTALAEFSFASLAPGGVLKGVDFDSDQNLWVLVNTSGVYTKLKVLPHTDVMMIDYAKKVIFLKELYDQVRVG